jgi:hypothetical protein
LKIGDSHGGESVRHRGAGTSGKAVGGNIRHSTSRRDTATSARDARVPRVLAALKNKNAPPETPAARSRISVPKAQSVRQNSSIRSRPFLMTSMLVA